MDRNWKQQGRRWWKFKSLSARRAWIEIPCARFKPIVKSVALRKESVDRNPSIAAAPSISALSLSARRAWIEISGSYSKANTVSVALRKESVDRNPML